MAKILLLLLLVAVVSAEVAPHVEVAFQEWRAMHGKFYATKKEYVKRLGAFVENMEVVREHNAKGLSFSLGLGPFADMSNEEYRQVMLPHRRHVAVKAPAAPAAPKNLGDIDWRQHGIVNPIKDQGQCGSCYAFGGMAAVEGAYAQRTGTLENFSEQNIVDCSQDYGNEGCNGGWQYSTMDYVIDHGIMRTSDYPYHAYEDTCHFDDSKAVHNVISRRWQSEEGDENALETSADSSIVAIAIDASHISFQLYRNGVYIEKSCSPEDLDHAVAIVGYSNGGGQKYWIVRNSWGVGWGNQGYIWMAKDKQNQCGVATEAWLCA